MIGKKSAKWIVGAGSVLAVALLFQHAKADQAALTDRQERSNVFRQSAPESTTPPDREFRFERGFRYEDGVTPHARTRRS